jgi:hypothetical protein
MTGEDKTGGSQQSAGDGDNQTNNGLGTPPPPGVPIVTEAVVYENRGAVKPPTWDGSLDVLLVQQYVVKAQLYQRSCKCSQPAVVADLLSNM